MKKTEILQAGTTGYEAPILTVATVAVEKGFAVTNDSLEDETYE